MEPGTGYRGGSAEVCEVCAPQRVFAPIAVEWPAQELAILAGAGQTRRSQDLQLMGRQRVTRTPE